MEIRFKDWLEAVGAEVVDPYFLDDPEIGLNPGDRAKGEFYILFTILSAGKPSHQQTRSLAYFLSLEDRERGGDGGTPFERIRSMIDKGTLVRNLSLAGVGTYNRFARSFIEISRLNLDSLKGLPPEELDAALRRIPNVSDKIINFIRLYVDQTQPVAILDRWILRSMKRILLRMAGKGQKLPARLLGGHPDAAALAATVPEDSPPPRTYPFWAALWHYLMERFKLSDLDVWRHQAMIGVDPLWKYKPVVRGKGNTVSTDERGRDLIDLSIRRQGGEGRKGVNKDAFLGLDLEPHVGQRGAWRRPGEGGWHSHQGDSLEKVGDTFYAQGYRDREHQLPPEAEAYRRRWLDKLRHYQDLGLYDDLGEEERQAYQQYARSLGINLPQKRRRV